MDVKRTSKDAGGCVVDLLHRQPLVEWINQAIPSLAGLRDPSVTRAVRWTPALTSMIAILMAFAPDERLLDRFEAARNSLDPRLQRLLPTSYNGFAKALVRQLPGVLPTLKADLRQQVTSLMPMDPERGDWRLLMADGSKVELPRTRSNEAHFKLAGHGNFPLASLTTIVDAMTGMVVDWCASGARASEQADLITMLEKLPEKTLLLLDAGYTGYPLWRELIQKKVHFVARVGGNVSLMEHLFPRDAAKVARCGKLVFVWRYPYRPSEPPLILRLVQVGHGKDRIYLVSSVLDRSMLTDAQVGRFYRRRWGVEVFYRTFKQVLGATKMCSASGRRADAELNWTMLALAVLLINAVRDIPQRRRVADRVSAAAALRAIRRANRTACSWWHSKRARFRLDPKQVKMDTAKRRRPKASRYSPPSDTRPNACEPPRIRAAPASLRAKAARLTPLCRAA